MLLKGAYCVGEHFVDPQCWPIKMAVWRGVQDRVYPLSTFALYNKKATSLLYQIKNVR